MVCLLPLVFKGTSSIWLHCWAWKQWADGDKGRDGHHHQSGEWSLWSFWAVLHGVTSLLDIELDVSNAARLKVKKKTKRNLKAAEVSWSEGVIKWQVYVSHTHTHTHAERKEGRIKVAKLREQTWCHYSPSGAVQRSLTVCWPAYFFVNQGLSEAGQDSLSQENNTGLFFASSWRFWPVASAWFFFCVRISASRGLRKKKQSEELWV